MRIRLKHRRLAELIAASGLTQNHWAIRLGLSRGHWSGLVNGNHPFPSAKTRTRILEAFETAFDDLFEIDATEDAWADVDFRQAIADRYIVDSEIGQGGMGAVHLARDVRHGRLVAIKVIAPEAVSGIGLVQFQREISTVAQLHHPHILSLHESGEISGQPYFVMPYVRGGSLRARLLRDTRMTLADALPLVRGIAEALDYAHGEHVLHCDIKPENILLHREHAWLTDFGIARRLHAESEEWPRRRGLDTSAGTPAYVSPEQAAGDPNLDARSDVYSFGCVVYEMLAGRSPFEGSNTQQIVSRRFVEPPPPLRDFVPDIPVEVQTAIERAMAIPRERRHTTALEFANDLARAALPRTALHRASTALWSAASRTQRTLHVFPRRPIGGLVRAVLGDIQNAWRVTRRNVRFSTLSALTMALGIGAVTSAFAVMNTVLLKPLPYPQSEQLVRMQERAADGTSRAPSYPNFDDWRSRARTFSGIAAISSAPPRTVILGSEPVQATALGVTRDYFRVLGARPLAGRDFSPEETQPGGPTAAMVSERFWRTRMNAAPMPTALQSNGETTPVVGVVPSSVQLFGNPDIYLAADRFPGTIRNAHAYAVIGRVSDNASLTTARADMTALSKSMREQYGATTTDAADALLTPLRDYVAGNYRSMLPYVVGAAALVLLIACTNVVSVNLAHGLSRQREMAVRAALGAARARIARQLFAESALVVGFGVILGSALAYGIVRVVRIYGAGLLPRLSELAIDGRIMAFGVGTTVICALLVGTYPAWRLSQGHSSDMLRGTRDARGGMRMRAWRVLVGVQTALALILLVGSLLLVRTLQKILAADTGFDPRGVITAQLTRQENTLGTLDDLGARLAGTPGISGVAFANALPFAWNSYSAPLFRRSDPALRDWPAFAGIRVVTPGYFEVLRQRVVSGRTFQSSDNNAVTPVAVLTRGAAEKLWPGESALGKVVATTYDTTRWMTVVGVVEEAASWAMVRGTQNEIYIPLKQWPMHAYELFALVRTDRSTDAMLPVVRARLRELAPNMPPKLGTLERQIASSAVERRFAMAALLAFAGIALLLAAMGVYGVISYSVATRRQEIGVRLALGATPGLVRAGIVRDAVLMVGGGVIVGGAAALFATKYLQASLYGVTRLDVVSYVVSVTVLMAVAIVGSYAPARRSSRVDPLVALRSD